MKPGFCYLQIPIYPSFSVLSLSLGIKYAVCVAYGGITKKTVTEGPAAEVECKEHVCVDSCAEHVSVCICTDLAGKNPSALQR